MQNLATFPPKPSYLPVFHTFPRTNTQHCLFSHPSTLKRITIFPMHSWTTHLFISLPRLRHICIQAEHFDSSARLGCYGCQEVFHSIRNRRVKRVLVHIDFCVARGGAEHSPIFTSKRLPFRGVWGVFSRESTARGPEDIIWLFTAEPAFILWVTLSIMSFQSIEEAQKRLI